MTSPTPPPQSSQLALHTTSRHVRSSFRQDPSFHSYLNNTSNNHNHNTYNDHNASAIPTGTTTTTITSPPPSPKRKRKTFFSILYASVYTFLFLILLIFLLVTPADAIRQAVEHSQYYNVTIVGVAYVATVLIVGFVYAARLFVTRNVLASIPREGSWGVGWCDAGCVWGSGRGGVGSGGGGSSRGGIGGWGGRVGQVEAKGEVADMIKVSLSRNAAVAWEAKPRVVEEQEALGSRGQLGSSGTAVAGGEGKLRANWRGIWSSNMPIALRGRVVTTVTHAHMTPHTAETNSGTRVGSGETGLVGVESQPAQENEKVEATPRKSTQTNRLKKTVTMEQVLGTALPPHHQVWGPISHPGWSGPNSPDLPNLQYSTVLSELPNLIEAKALTLAPAIPTDDGFDHGGDAEVQAAEAQAALQRQGDYIGLRDYLATLTHLGVLDPESDHLVSDFLGRYETARFSTRSATEDEFRTLMRLFASLLRAMRPLSSWGNIPGGSLDDYGYNPDGQMRGTDDSDPDDPPANSLSSTTPRSQRSVASLRSLRSRRSSRRLGASRTTMTHVHDPVAGGDGNQSDADSFAEAVFLQHHRPHLVARASSSSILARGGGGREGGGNPVVYRTAPTTPMSMTANLATLPLGYAGGGAPATGAVFANPNLIGLSRQGGGAGGGYDSASSFAQTRKVFEVSSGDEHSVAGAGGTSRDGSLRQAFLPTHPVVIGNGRSPDGEHQEHQGSVRRGRPGLGAAGLGSLRSQRGEISGGGNENGSGRSESSGFGPGSIGSGAGSSSVGRSLRSARSQASFGSFGSGSGSAGSVIRLARPGEGGLPYVLRLGGR